MQPAHPRSGRSVERTAKAYESHTVDPLEELGCYKSVAYQRALTQLQRFARDRRAAILIEGESGTGKTRLARLVHALSPRAGNAFEQVVLSAADDALIGSALFGHVNGAYTDARYARAGHFASANGGTLFLDEIGKASLIVQQKLLHVIECGEFRPVGSDRDTRVDVRIIAASNVSLESLAVQGSFLSDLFARLRTFRVYLPALRERRADIPLLAQMMVHARALDVGYRTPPDIASDLLHALQQAPWPHNLRQLDATLHRILIDAEGAEVLTLAHCMDDMAFLRDTSCRPALTPDRIAEALTSQGSMSAAARALGVDRTTLYRHRRARPSSGHPPSAMPTSPDAK
jgi:two-component system NtrC family response regulator